MGRDTTFGTEEVAIDAVRGRLVLAFRLAVEWRPTGVRLRALGRATLTSFLSVGGMLWLLPDLRASGPMSVLYLVLIVFGVGAVVRPLLIAVAVLFGAAGLLLLGVVTQSLVLQLAFTVTPDVHTSGFVEIFVASWVVALIAAVVNWIFDVGSDDAFLARVVRHAARAARLDPHACTGPGVLIVQIDGLGADVMRQAVTAGALPTIPDWLRSGTHTWRRWDTGLPATTPAGQAALLHGNTSVVPGFRWYEKDARRMMVANRTRDAAEIERRASDGRGLLADGGVSVSNLLTGDAPTRLLTMSDPKLSTHARFGIGAYLAARGGLPRTVVLMLGEMITELQQGRRQRRRGVRPRVHRVGVFVLLRAVTTVLLRNLSVSLVSDHLAAGAKVIFVDFVDYDEVAHHAGPSRAESIRTLDGIDRVVRVLHVLSRLVNRSYEVVVVSDHGQAQGATFSQLAGRSLDDVVAELSDVGLTETGDTSIDTAPAERWGPVNVLATTVARAGGRGRRGPARRALRRRAASNDGARSVAFGPSRHDRAHAGERPVVAAGGSLAHVYLPEVTGRADVDRIALEHPRLLDGLRTHPQVGLVLVRLASGQPAAFGASGWREVTPAGARGGEGDDPVAVNGPDAAAALAQLDTREHVGDLVVLGRYDPTWARSPPSRNSSARTAAWAAGRTRPCSSPRRLGTSPMTGRAGWTVPTSTGCSSTGSRRSACARVCPTLPTCHRPIRLPPDTAVTSRGWLRGSTRHERSRAGAPARRDRCRGLRRGRARRPDRCGRERRGRPRGPQSAGVPRGRPLRRGRRVLRRHPHPLGQPLAERVGWLNRGHAAETLQSMREQIEQRELTVLLTSRLIPGGRVPVLLAAALGGYSWRRFAVADIAAASLWSFFYALIGLLGRAVFPEPWQAAVAAIVLVLLVSAGSELWKRRGHRTGSQPNARA